MRKLSTTLVALCAAALLAGVAGAGGRAEVKVNGAPGRVEAGKPFELAIQVTPATWTRARNIEPVVTAVCGERKVVTSAVALRRANHYRATLNLPAAGEWKIRVDSRYCETVMSPVSVRAVAAAAPRKGRSQG